MVLEGASPTPSNHFPGGDLLSHAVASAVPSALEGLTSVFGMGTGVAPPVSPPGSGIEHGDPRVQPHDVHPCIGDKVTVVKPHGRLVPVS